MGELDLVGIRDASADDLAFIIDSWLASFRNSHFAGPISMRRYREVYRVEICSLIDRPGVIVRVAYYRENPSQILGFLCFDRGRGNSIVHFAYVKKPFRRRGIFALLMNDAGIDTKRKFSYTYRTRAASELTAKGARFERARFDPFDARYDPEHKEEEHEAKED